MKYARPRSPFESTRIIRSFGNNARCCLNREKPGESNILRNNRAYS